MSPPLPHPSTAEGALASILWPPRWLPAAVEAIFSTATGGLLQLGGALRLHVPPGGVLPEFIVWSAEPASTRLPLPHFLLGELPAGAPGGLWLQADGCCSRASWVSLEVSAAGSLFLARGWQTFARARGLSRRCTLHFKFDGDATLYVRVFGEDGRRAGCCPEGDDRGWEPSSGDDGEGSARRSGFLKLLRFFIRRRLF